MCRVGAERAHRRARRSRFCSRWLRVATNVYVDAFNLYYGCLKETPYRWLDLGALCTQLLPRDQINRIRYFTAALSVRPDDRQRQQIYLRALETVPGLSIHYGHFLSHVVRMPLANPPSRGPRTVAVVKTEEKSSDVNLATLLLLDAFRRECDVAVVSRTTPTSSCRSRSRSTSSACASASSIHIHLRAAAAPSGQRSSSRSVPRRWPRASSRRSSPTPQEKFTSPRAGSETQRPAEAGLAPSRRRGWGDRSDRSLRSGGPQTAG